MARKFIVTDTQFIMGNVGLHMDLLSKRTEKLPVLGGGRWDMDSGRKILYLWGESVDYGYAKPEDIKRAIESGDTYIRPDMEGWTVMHSPVIMANQPEVEDFEVLMILPS